MIFFIIDRVKSLLECDVDVGGVVVCRSVSMSCRWLAGGMQLFVGVCKRYGGT